MPAHYVISARQVRKGEFIAEPGRVRYLKVPEGALPAPAHEIRPHPWIEEVQALAAGEGGGGRGTEGDVLVFVHGYNNDAPVIRDRHLRLQADLAAEGWRGVVVSFDWPSDDSTLNYLEDRSDAAEVAGELVTRGVVLLARAQDQGCPVNVHLLGHSTGAYVIMEAFGAAGQHGALFKSDWRVAQVAFVGGDVSRSSLDADSAWAEPMYARIMRLTNYANPFDHVLAASNAKRLGVAPRAGRVGLGDTPHEKAINVHCGDHFKSLDPGQAVHFGTFAHSWHIGDRVFARDLAMTLEGRIDREAIPTRERRDGRLCLVDAPRPRHYDEWTSEGPGG